jgi:hypothetical protein
MSDQGLCSRNFSFLMECNCRWMDVCELDVVMVTIARIAFYFIPWEIVITTLAYSSPTTFERSYFQK